MRKFRTLTGLLLGELSMVDFPAQEPALAKITKRKTLVELPSTSTKTPVQKNDQEIPMTDAEKKALEDAQADLAKSKADLDAVTKQRDLAVATADAVLELSEDHRSFAKKLTGAARAAFVAKSAAERSAQVEAARGREVYKRRDGKTFYESDDPEIVALWKRDDKREEEMEAIKAEKTEAVMKSRVAKSLGNVGGKDDGKIVLLKAIAAWPNEEERKLAEAVIEKANSQCARSFERHSSGGSEGMLDDAQDPETILEKRADDIAKRLQLKDSSLDYIAALQKAHESSEYVRLADEIFNR